MVVELDEFFLLPSTTCDNGTASAWSPPLPLPRHLPLFTDQHWVTFILFDDDSPSFLLLISDSIAVCLGYWKPFFAFTRENALLIESNVDLLPREASFMTF